MVFFAAYNSPLGLVVIESDEEVLTGLRFADENVCSDRAERGETETGMMEWGEVSGGKLMCGKAVSAMPVIASTVRWLDDYFSGKASSTMPIIAATIRWLDDYFSGKQTENATMNTHTENSTMGKQTDVQIVVKPKGTMFQQRIWQVLLTIPYGDTVSYGEIAKMVGCRSAQAVGQAIGANPIALIIPCHRVIAANGKLGGYAYGEQKKKRLLELEQQCKH